MPFFSKSKTSITRPTTAIESCSSWSPGDTEALENLKVALKDYYNGENISERSAKLATLKMFGSWDDACDEEKEEEKDDDCKEEEKDDDSQSERAVEEVEEEPNEEEQDPDVQAWRSFCEDMSFLDDNPTQQRQQLFEEDSLREVVESLEPKQLNIWPVAIVNHPNNNTPSQNTLSKLWNKPHVTVIFASQDQYQCAYGFEVQATPKSKVRDIYAGQGLAKF